MDVKITVVHGTWAHGLTKRTNNYSKKSKWFQPESEFLNAIEKKLKERQVNASFDTCYWTGGNNLSARRQAALKLLKEHLIPPTTIPHIVVAHSHGGNIALHAINALPKKKRPDGCITLATPFIRVRDRDREASKIENFFYDSASVFVMVLVFFLLSMVSAFVYNFVLTYDFPGKEPLFGLILVSCMSSLVDLFHDKVSPFLERLKRKTRLFCSKQEAYPTQLFVLRCPRDEASMTLYVAELIDRISRLLLFVVGVPFRIMSYFKDMVPVKWREKTYNAIFPSVMVLIITTFIAGIGIFFPELPYLGSLMESFTSAFIYFLMAILGPPLGIVTFVSLGVIFGVGLLTVGCFVVSAVGFLLFGVEYTLLAITREVCVASIPRGAHKIKRVRKAKGVLAHSIYESDDAQNELCDWIASVAHN